MDNQQAEPFEGPDIDLSPGAVEPGVLSDNSVVVPPGVDPIEYATTLEGQSAEDDVQEGQAPEGGPQEPEEPSGDDNPPTIPADQSPDMLDLTELTDEQIVELARKDPDAIRRHQMRLNDYRRKTAELARIRRELEQQPQPQEAEPQQVADTQNEALARMQSEHMRYYNDLMQELGREPNYLEMIVYAANRAAREVAAQVVEPLQQQVHETAEQFRARQERELADRLEREWDELVREFPQASRPDRQEQLYEILSQNPGLLNLPKPLHVVYRGLFGEQDSAAMKTAQQKARQQQAAAAAAAPSTPPTGHANPPGEPPTNLEDFYNTMLARARAGTLLDRVPRP